MQHYFYVPGSFSALEPVEMLNGEHIGQHSRNTLESLRQHYPAISILSLDECFTAIREAARMPVQQISAATYDLFRQSQIMDFVSTAQGISFKCREFSAADIVTCFSAVTVSDQPMYFTFRDIETVTHEEIVLRITQFINESFAPENIALFAHAQN